MEARHAGRALIVALAAATALRAAPARAQAEKGEFFDPGNEVKHYTHNLSLTDAQKPKVLALMKEKLAVYKKAASQRQRISKESKELTQRIQRLNKQLEATQKEQADSERRVAQRLRDLLDEKQKKKFDAMLEQQEKQRREFEAAHQDRLRQGRDEGRGPQEDGPQQGDGSQQGDGPQGDGPQGGPR